ncbi:MAG: 23S rRNA (uracil(1939)-C(5))-methyltransferase RlmD [Betaproteobacteria bacterium]|nr:23S rRNA (uracil(1939)-C(5))-methyltransferase RlmD [Betaproteobacteria bacterium]
MRSRSNKPRGEPREARIESLDHEGRGIARLDGKAVFIEGALPGERVVWQATRIKPSFEEGEARRVLKESPDRVAPGCDFFGLCGGCAMQHASPALQLAAKQRVLEDNLARIGKVEPEQILPPISGSPWGYRHRARLSVHHVPKKGGVLVGFRERKSSYVADMASCEVLPRHIGHLISPLRELMTSLDGRERIPQIEVAIGAGVTVLVLRVLEPLSQADEDRLRIFADAHRIQWWQQPKGPDTAVAWYPLGAPPLTYRLPEFNLELAFRPTEFTQVNHEVNERMVKRAVDLLDPRQDEAVVDLFCGLGNFSLAIARRGAHVVGVEGSEALVKRAGENAARNGLSDHARFFSADLYTDPARAVASLPKAGKWLIDPPRDGAVEVCKLVDADTVKRIVYVSCSPSTLARDAEVLVQTKGYRLRAAGVVNMFPHTAHVESIALFEQ